MKRNLQKGDILEPVLILVFLSLITFVFIIPKHSGTLNSPLTLSGGSAINGNSYYTGSVSLSQGNAASSNQPADEYITISNNSNTPADITGWTLKNGKGERTYSVGGNDVRFAPDVAIIPRGASLPTSAPLSDIVLKPGDRAIVNTGGQSVTNPYLISSFKENKCSGYLADSDTYQYHFSPYLENSCLAPSQEAGLGSLDISCQKFINNLQVCRAPKFDAVDYQGHTVDHSGNTCTGCVNGVTGLSNSCQLFLKNHYTYPSCLAQHQNDPDFYSRTWHIYLNRQWEMWAADHETITLLDKVGHVVDTLSY